ncbi:MAG: ankyrin repeat domain-containing protein [Candidatus Midichloria mitochondrii]|nr:ankyrin repeat domain-containing protein [Candidatus Midichloria mitochondrii]MDJ1256761.1 ankyrin repeat domain-containing protein [Candidatus Midichloria mitochondrii]MDJ1288470.1 ankyrin repeat domain-containing protein [Candidatus Midichloria mitochondrii]MDJ1299319.1 ankyrin repeat domain-containing protein [Candidatus Midichloria mitochondrii]MDJ1313437.1 ankyrin repeat domain-containing protein [Candidatus Midichloria mitochondrii]MDJ1584009.1 ankyrin repeat domain-containing protein
MKYIAFFVNISLKKRMREDKVAIGRLFAQGAELIGTWNISGFKELLIQHPELFRGVDGKTLLNLVVIEGQEEIISFLLKKRFSDITSKDNPRRNPLHLSYRRN